MANSTEHKRNNTNLVQPLRENKILPNSQNDISITLKPKPDTFQRDREPQCSISHKHKM